MNALACLLLTALAGEPQPEVDGVYLKSQTREVVRLWTTDRPYRWENGRAVRPGDLQPLEKICTKDVSLITEPAAARQWMRAAIKARLDYVAALPEPETALVRHALSLERELLEHCYRTNRWPHELFDWVIDEELFSLRSRRDAAKLDGDLEFADACQARYDDLVRHLRYDRLLRCRKEVENSRGYWAKTAALEAVKQRHGPRFASLSIETMDREFRQAERRLLAEYRARLERGRPAFPQRAAHHGPPTKLDTAEVMLAALEEHLRVREERYAAGEPLFGPMKDTFVSYAGMGHEVRKKIGRAVQRHDLDTRRVVGQAWRRAKRVDDEYRRLVAGSIRGNWVRQDMRAERVWERRLVYSHVGEDYFLTGRD